MADAPDFPLELKLLVKDCVLAIFWPKKKIIEFLESSGCTENDLKIVKSPDYSHLRRPELIEAVYYRLAQRQDRGYTVFHMMLSRLAEWSSFDPYWFDDQKKLDRDHANERLVELRRVMSARNAKTTAQRAAATKSTKVAEDHENREEILKSFRILSQGGIKPQQRGYEFEKLLVRLFKQQGISLSEGFTLTGEQIDGAFKFEGENYIVEAKWQDSSVSTESLYKFAMKADGKMYGRGVFISVNAYSLQGIRAIVTGKHIKTILIDGEDITLVLEGLVTLENMLDVKIRAAQTRGDVYVHPLTQTSKV